MSKMENDISDTVIDLMAEKFKMLADPTRLAILRSLVVGEKSVNRLVEETGRGQANVSKHLKLLADAGYVARRKDGLQVFYRVDCPLVVQVCSLVCETIARNTEMEIRRGQELLDALAGAEAARQDAVR